MVKSINSCLEYLVILFCTTSCAGQQSPTAPPGEQVVGTPTLGTGINQEKDAMDTCSGAAGPRPVTGVFSPGRTDYATIDNVSNGFCGVAIDKPGIWWWVEGTGGKIKASSCYDQTKIKVKMSVFTGNCTDLRCVTGSAEPDYECPILKLPNELNEWDTMATAVTFQTRIDQNYYILVQQDEQYDRGDVWMSFIPPVIPQNDNCVDSIGPVPRNERRILATSVDASVSDVPQGYCGGDAVPSLYPGTWFQIMGTGGKVSVMACSEFNFDGYAFSVYVGENCDSLECVTGQYNIYEDNEKCTFGPAAVQRSITEYSFNTIDRSRYYIYVYFAQTRADKPTADFRFFVNDGESGEASSSGGHVIEFEESTNINGDDGENGSSDSVSANLILHKSWWFIYFVLLVWMIIQ